MTDEPRPILQVRGLHHRYPGAAIESPSVHDVTFTLGEGEVLAVVGESGSGKSSLLSLLAGRLCPVAGGVWYRLESGDVVEVHQVSERVLRRLQRTEWGFVEQHPRDGLRLHISAGGNIAERLMDVGERRHDVLRAQARNWMRAVSLDDARIDDVPIHFSGGMCQRLQLARNLVSSPRLLLMDEPTSGLDVSVQAGVLDLLKTLVDRLRLAVVIVTHDLGVASLLAHRILVMQSGRVVEQGLADRVLQDPRHPYTQLLVSSVLAT